MSKEIVEDPSVHNESPTEVLDGMDDYYADRARQTAEARAQRVRSPEVKADAETIGHTA